MMYWNLPPTRFQPINTFPQCASKPSIVLGFFNLISIM
ncbi:hypothetical protein PSPO_b0521 [Pseudoalteromonas spongiae UST010723-006]|nr:hypothetical protein PSPO_b0521 [Pseudoalteromonas spongiae UST010723-006]